MDNLNPEELSFYYDVSNSICTYIIRRYLSVIDVKEGVPLINKDDIEYDSLEPLIPIINAVNIFAFDTFGNGHEFPQNMIDICTKSCDTDDISEIGSFILATYNEYMKIEPLAKMSEDIYAFVPMVLMDYIACGLMTNHLPYDASDIASIILENMIDSINS